ncbi:MAG: glycosyltransferase family 9 protein [Nanoarchaeota archaeon]|nr:glycosyltransferase family 9 protein [Nanoarchaeota archaeon]MBU4086938.1 glycosyltransferase family 9 protein [Nanoarchaeota archaeon]
MKIIIIKLGALGDVVRTLSILPAIKERYPESEVCWITKPESLEVFEGNPYITKVITIPCNISEEFDVLYNFDIDDEATKLASEIKADKKYGFYKEGDYAAAFNISAEYYLNTLFDDELKKSNKKSYQQMMFDVAELDYKQNHCPIYLNKKDSDYANKFLRENNIDSNKLLGIHLGASARWPSKAWHLDNLKEFILKAKSKGFEILLFAGPNEKDKNKKLAEELKRQGVKIFINNPKNTLKEFASLVSLCKQMVCSDSLSLHVSLALKKPTIGLFFCTSPDEAEDYGLLKKIVSPLLKDFFPEKSDQYSEELVKSISAEDVLKAIDKKK